MEPELQMTESEIRHAVSDELVRDVLRERRSERRWRLIKRGMMVAAGVVFFALYLFGYAKQMGWKMIPNNEITAVIHIDGEISAGATASAEKVVPCSGRPSRQERQSSGSEYRQPRRRSG